MTLPIENKEVVHPVNDMLRTTILGALSFLVAIETRDLLAKSISLLMPGDTQEKMIFSLFVLLVIILITVLAISYWA